MNTQAMYWTIGGAILLIIVSIVVYVRNTSNAPCEYEKEMSGKKSGK